MQEIKTSSRLERAILVGVIHKNHNELETLDYLDELELLAETAGAFVVKKYIQKM